MNAQTSSTAVATAVRRPQPTDFKPLQDLTVSQLLEDPRVMKAMAESAPKHLSPQRLLRVMAQALRKTPKLAQCHPLSLLGAMISCATLGLEPNTPLGHAYLIPFEKRKKVGTQWVTDSVEVNLIIGYQGLIDLSRRTGNLVSIHADVVYEGDEFSFEYGSHMHLRHVPTGSREGRNPIYAYAHAKLDDGEAFEVLPYAEVLKVRDNTQAYKQAMVGKSRGDKNWGTTPWVAYEHEMACKTLVRRVSKWLPKSIEFATAVQMDSMAERGMIDFQAIAAQPALAHDPEAAAMAEDETIEQPPQQQTKPQPPKAATPPKPATAEAPREEDSEEAQREADRMSRAAQGESVEEHDPETGEIAADGWDDYMAKMLGEFTAAKKPKDQDAVTTTFRDAVLGALERKEIVEPRANALLAAWKDKTATGNGKK